MGDQSEIKELRHRVKKLEDAYNKDKKRRKTLLALLRLMFIKLKKAYAAIEN